MASDPRPVLYVLGRFPARSETFITRELVALHAAGLPLQVLRLRGGGKPPAGIALVADDGRGGNPLLATRLLGAGLPYARRQHRNLAYFLAILPRLAAALAQLPRGGIRAVHAHWATVPALAGMLIARELDVPFSFTTHAYDLFTNRSLVGALAPYVRALVTVCEYNRRVIADRFGPVVAARTVVARCGLTAAELAPDPSPPPRDPQLLLTAGRLVPKKGMDTLLNAIAAAGPALAGHRLVIIGDGPERGPLERQARKLGLAERIEFAGWQGPARIRGWLQQAGLFVLPCRVTRDGDRDALPVVILEAMAAGCPVLTTGVAGIPEAVAHGRTGWLVPPDDSSTLAQALVGVANDPVRRERMAAAAAKWVRAEAAISDTIQPLLDLFGDNDDAA